MFGKCSEHAKHEKRQGHNMLESKYKRRKNKNGEGGIRTHEQVAPLLDFESSSFGHSDTSPRRLRSYTKTFGFTSPDLPLPQDFADKILAPA